MMGTSAIPSSDRLADLVEIMRLVNDAGAATKRIADLQAAAQEARTAIDQAKKDRAALARDRAKSELEIEDAKTAADGELVQKRTVFAAECDRKRKELEAREAAVADREAQARMDADAAAALKADAEKRLAAIRKAAS